MLHHAGLFFALTLVTSMAGFGGILENAVLIAKALAVVCLLLFFVSLYRVLHGSSAPGGLAPRDAQNP